jgi:hypothetical protein
MASYSATPDARPPSNTPDISATAQNFRLEPASAQRPLTIRLIGSPRTQVSDETRALQRSTKALTLPASSSTPAFAVDLDAGHGEVGHLGPGLGRHARLITEPIHLEAHHLGAPAFAEGEGNGGPQARR